MKTAESRAYEFSMKFFATDTMADLKDAEMMSKKIEILLKDQDKATRHAAIEDVNALYVIVDNDVVDCDTITSVIMNTKAV